MENIQEIPARLCRELKYFFCDLDDTVTTKGLLTASAFQSIWDLYQNNLRVVLVTGRPAGWCDHIARMWPVWAVIGENGAFYYRYDRTVQKMHRAYLTRRNRRSQQSLKHLARLIVKKVPGCAISADQDFRLTDLAIDFCEDVTALGPDQVEKICLEAQRQGASFRVSSIHVNCWFAAHTKFDCVRQLLLNDGYQEIPQENVIFIGDSPNDEPLFKAFRYAVGVANLLDFKDRLKCFPLYMSDFASGRGFTQAVKIILAQRLTTPQSGP